MNDFKISVIHPTARIDPSSPLWWKHSMEAFFRACDRPEQVEYVLVVHASNWDAFERTVPYDWPLWGAVIVARNTDLNTSNAQGNWGGRASSGQVLVGNMDDLFPPEHWDSQILEALGPFIDRPRVLHVSTGSPSDDKLFNPGIMTRARYMEFGYGCHPAYESMFADNEFTEVARRDNVVIEARHIRFEHRHPAFGTAQMDDVYRQENRGEAYFLGRRTFEARRSQGFPKDPDWALPPMGKNICLCLPGEHFGNDYLHGLLQVHGTLLRDSRFNHVGVAMAHTTNVYATRYILTEMVLDREQPRPDYVFWLDDDNVISPNQLLQLVEDLEQNPELSGVVGWCWCDRGSDKTADKPFVMSCGLQGENLEMYRLDLEDLERAAEKPIVHIDWSGLPCALFRIEVVERLGPGAFAPMVRPDVKFGFTSEDTSFFYRAKQAGFQFAVDLRVKVPHMKLRAIEPQWVPRPEGVPV